MLHFFSIYIYISDISYLGKTNVLESDSEKLSIGMRAWEKTGPPRSEKRSIRRDPGGVRAFLQFARCYLVPPLVCINSGLIVESLGLIIIVVESGSGLRSQEIVCVFFTSRGKSAGEWRIV